MKWIPIGLLALVAFATTASAATLGVVSDKGTYNPGETITLTVTGDSQGAAGVSIHGELTYSAALTNTVTSSQTLHTSFGGALPWVSGVLSVGEGSAVVFNQLCCVTPFPVDQLQIATATLVAEAGGTVTVSWNASTLDFFGVGGAATGTTFTIVPEPTTAALLGVGLLGLATSSRRQRLVRRRVDR